MSDLKISQYFIGCGRRIETGPVLHEAANHYVFFHAQVARGYIDLKSSAQPESGNGVAFKAGDFSSSKDYPARINRMHSGNAVKKSGLPGAVGSDDAKHLTFRHIEAD